MEEAKVQAAPPPPPVRPGMAAAVHRRRVQALSREQQRDLEQNADLLALCKTFGLQVDLPRIFIVGPQSAGKSTLMELLFRFLKVGATGTGRVTRCPVAYYVRVVQNERPAAAGAGRAGAGAEPPRYFYRFEITINGRTTPVDQDRVVSTLNAHMETIKNAEGFSSETVTVTITTNDPNHTSKYIIDTPGIIQNDEDETLVDGVWNVVHTTLRGLREHDVVIVVASAEEQPSSFSLLQDPARIGNQRTLRLVDPDLSHIVPVIAKADKFFPAGKDGDTYPGNQKGGEAFLECLTTWTTAFHGHQPALMVTHCVSLDVRADMTSQEYKKTASAQIETKQSEWDTVKDKWALPPAVWHNLVTTLEQFELPLLVTNATHAKQARAKAMKCLEQAVSKAKARRRELWELRASMMVGNLQGELNHIAECFFALFCQAYHGQHSNVWQKYRTTLPQDLARIDPRFKFPTVRDPGDGAGARGPTPAEEKAYQDLVKSRNVPLSTNAVGSHAHVNTRNNDTAICSLVVDDAREQLVEDGTRYLLEGIKQRLLTVVDAVFEYLWSTKLRKFATRHNASFMDRVTQQVKDAIESIMNSMYHQLVAFQTQALDGVTVEFPAMLSLLPDLIVAADKAVAGKDPMGRAGSVSDVLYGAPAVDRAPTKDMYLWEDGSEELKDAQFAYTRHFSAKREAVATMAFMLVSNHIAARFTERDAPGGLLQCVRDYLIHLPAGRADPGRDEGGRAGPGRRDIDMYGRKVEEPGPGPEPEPDRPPRRQQQQGGTRTETALREFYGIVAVTEAVDSELAELDKQIQAFDETRARWTAVP